MAEGPTHVALVNLILSMLAPGVSGHEYAIFTDCAGENRDRRCPPIGGYIPDVYAVAARDLQMRVIGEAKVGKDFESPRTEPQMRSFLSFLAVFERPTLIFAVPLSSLAAAANMAARAAKTVPAHVRVVAIAPEAQRMVSEGWQI
jgi:hypothetical protein